MIPGLQNLFTKLAGHCDALLNAEQGSLSKDQRALISVLHQLSVRTNEILQLYLAELPNYTDRSLLLGHLMHDLVGPISSVANANSLLWEINGEIGVEPFNQAQLVHVNSINEICNLLLDQRETTIAELRRLRGRQID